MLRDNRLRILFAICDYSMLVSGFNWSLQLLLRATPATQFVICHVNIILSPDRDIYQTIHDNYHFISGFQQGLKTQDGRLNTQANDYAFGL